MRFRFLPLLFLLPLLGPVAALSAPAGEAKALGGTLVRLNDFGSDDIAYFSIPSREPLGGVVLVHDAWGLNDSISLLADRLAELGYITIVPDLFNGQKTADPERAADYRRGLSPASAQKTIAASVRFLRESPRFRAAHIGVVGWGMGSLLALQTAAADGPIEAVAIFGGPLDFDARKLARLNAPILAVFDAADPNLAPADRQRFAEFTGREKKSVEFHDLAEGALFAGNGFPAQAWGWLTDFLARSFAAPPPPAGVGGFFEKMNPFPKREESQPAKPVEGG